MRSTRITRHVNAPRANVYRAPVELGTNVFNVGAYTVVTGQLKMNAKRDVDKPAVIQEVTYSNGEAKFVYKTTVNPG